MVPINPDGRDPNESELDLEKLFRGGSFRLDLPNQRDEALSVSKMGVISNILVDYRGRLCIELSWMASRYTFGEWIREHPANFTFVMKEASVLYDGENTAFITLASSSMNITLYTMDNTDPIDHVLSTARTRID